MAGRDRYVVAYQADDHDAGRVCHAVFDVLAGSVDSLRVDAYSDFADQMPDDIRTAQAWLRARGFARGDGDPGIAIAISSDDDTGWAIAVAYSPWSIRTVLYDHDGDALATLEDGGNSISITLSDTEAAALATKIETTASLVPLAPPAENQASDHG